MAATREAFGLLDIARRINPDTVNQMLCCTSVAYIDTVMMERRFYDDIPPRHETELEKVERELNEEQDRISRKVGMPE
jgi:hypothetical protein